MRRLVLDDVMDLAAYEAAREQFRARAMDAKAVRRVAVGPLITLFFENRLTMHYQLQEMLRAERNVKDAAVREELRTWNELIPHDDELSLTLMIEETDLSRAKERLHELRDLEPTLSLRIGARGVPAHFEEGWRDENRISAVQFIRFKLSPDDRAAFLHTDDLRVRIEHRAYRHEAKLPRATVEALREDLAERD